jgi:prepilin-type N-terminal cleavage/methylation domain-containing protein
MHGRGDRMVPKALMILATGKQADQAFGTKGFTLIEIVLVLGLMAFAAAVVITNFASLADRGDSLSSEEILQAAVSEARFVAASERIVTEPSSGKNFPLSERFNSEGPASMQFYLVPPSEGLAAPADASRTRLETNVVKFAPDRSSSPFVVDIDTGSGTPKRLIFDPFSSLLITPK